MFTDGDAEGSVLQEIGNPLQYVAPYTQFSCFDEDCVMVALSKAFSRSMDLNIVKKILRMQC